jgi:hypothetical protein
MPTIQGKRYLNNTIALPPESFTQKVNFKIYNFQLFGAAIEVAHCSEIEFDLSIPAMYYLIDYTEPSMMTNTKTSVYSTRELDFGDEPQDVSEAFYSWITSTSTDDEFYSIRASTLHTIADAIRFKEGSTERIPTEEMGDRILALAGGSYPADLPSYQKWKFNDTQTFATTDANNPTLRVYGDFIFNGKYCEYVAFTHSADSTKRIDAYIRDKVSATGATLGTQVYTVYENGIWLDALKEFYILGCNSLVTSKTDLAKFGHSSVDEFMSAVATEQ